MTKQIPQDGIQLADLLEGILNDVYSKTCCSRAFLALGFIGMRVDINAAEFYIGIRYRIQTVNIPATKTGNLKKFAGKKVDVICTTIQRGAPRINFYIREHK